MGGRLNVGVIEKDGTLKTIEGYTNTILGVMKREAFANGDFSGMRKWLSDYENDVFNEGFGPRANVPFYYGYLLFDLRDNVILGAQAYTHFTPTLAAEVSMALQAGDRERADEMARLITHRREWSEEEQSMVSVPIEGFRDAAHMSATPGAMRNSDGMSPNFEIAFPAWKLISHDRTPEGFEAIRDYLDERGLLSPSEKENWDFAIEERQRAVAEMAAEAAEMEAAVPRM